MRFQAAHRLARGLLIGASLLGVALLTTAGTAAETTTPQETTRSLRRALERLPYYGVFDHLTFSVDRGVVTLDGYAYNGSLRSAAEMAAKRTSGVDEVANRLEVLPASQEDDRIRWATFYRVYTDGFLSRYASGGEMRSKPRFQRPEEMSDPPGSSAAQMSWCIRQTLPIHGMTLPRRMT